MDTINKHPEYPTWHAHPTWWTGEDDSIWDRVKEALKRDLEQTRADLHLSKGRELHQTALDTVKQALGIEPLPLPHQPNTPREPT
jgi:hypothetical protein